MTKKILFYFPLAALLVCGGLAAVLNTNTYDEALHFANGERYWQGKADRINTNATMPVNALHAIPAQIENFITQTTGFSLFNWLPRQAGMESVGTNEMKVYSGRVVNLLFSLLLALLTFRWSRELYGENAALAALWLYAFCPTLLAMGPITNSDIFIAFFTTLALYTLWKWSLAPDWKKWLWAGITLGLVQAAKYHALFLFFIYPIVLILWFCEYRAVIACLPAGRRADTQPSPLSVIPECLNPGSRTTLRNIFLGILMLGITVILVINTCFLWTQIGVKMDSVEIKSHSFKKIQALIGGVPMPVAQPFWQGIDYVAEADEDVSSHGPAYLFGKLSPAGFKGYYFAAFLFKETLPFIFLTLAALLAFLKPGRWKDFRGKESFLLIPLIYYCVLMNFFSSYQTGIRYLLIVYPVLIILISSLLQNFPVFGKKKRALLLALFAWHALSPLAYTPNYISYFNELIGSRLNAYKYLADSNLCWGQNGLWLKRYLAKHPEAKVDPLEPTTGLIVMDVNRLLGISDKPETFAWLRKNHKPIGHVSHAHLIFEVKE